MTLQPIEAFGFDAAIIFSDILPPLVGMGFDLDFVGGVGPSIANPVRQRRDVDLLGTPAAAESMAGTLEAIGIVTRELTPRDVPVIGFAGAPFTLASYAIEGGAGKDFALTKSFMLAEPAAWQRLMTKLVTVQADYLLAQARAGASALQVFDSWAGRALGRDDYVRYVQPYNTRLFEAIRRRRAGDQLQPRRHGVHGGGGRLRRRRLRDRLADAARAHLGADGLPPARAGEPRPDRVARYLA